MVQGKSKYLYMLIGAWLILWGSNSPVNAAQRAETTSADNTLEILFLSNANALLENCHCGTPSLGGLARMSTLITQKRRKNPKLLLIDGGDFFNPYAYAKLNLAVLQIYRILKPDILALGDQEFVQGVDFLEQNVDDWQKVVTSNFDLVGKKTSKQQCLHLHGKKITVLTYLDKSSFDVIAFNGKRIRIKAGRFQEMYIRGVRDGYLIVVFHGSNRALKKFIKKYPRADLILAAHTQQEKSTLTSRPAVVYGGVDTRYIYDVLIDFGSPLNPITCRSFPVGEDLPQDKRILPIIKQFKADP